MLLAVLFPVCLFLAFAAADVPWNVTLQNHSPTIAYFPYSDGSINAGWSIWASDSGFNAQGGEYAAGTVFHTSAFPTASFSFHFRGTALTLYGSANATYSVSLDNHVSRSPFAWPDGVLYAASGLALTDHYISVTILDTFHNQHQLMFERAVYTTSSPDELTTVTYFGTERTDIIKFDGTWTKQEIPQVPTTANPVAYSETNVYLSSVSMNFTGARAVSANANLNWGHSNYTVRLDDATHVFNALTWWLIGDTTLFFADDLDPNAQHTIMLTHSMNADYYKFTFSSFSVWQPGSSQSGTTAGPQPTPPTQTSNTKSNTSTSSAGERGSNVNGSSQEQDSAKPASVSTGAIAGIVIGVVVLLTVVGAAIYFVALRKRARRQGDGVQALGEGSEKDFPAALSTSTQNSSPRVSPLITPFPAPTGSISGNSAPPASMSTEGGVRPYGAAPRDRKNRQRQQEAEVIMSPASGGPGATQQQVDQIIAMIAQRFDQTPGIVGNNVPPPSYPAESVSGR